MRAFSESGIFWDGLRMCSPSFFLRHMGLQESEPKNKKFEKITCDFTIKVRNNLFENQSLISLRDFLLPLLMNGQIGFKA